MRSAPFLLLFLASCASAPSARLPSAPAAPLAQDDPSCATDFDATAAIVSRDYSGYADARARLGTALAARTDSARAAVADGADEQACTRIIRRWLDAFRDPHLTLSGRATAPEGLRLPTQRPPAGGLSLRYLDDSTAVLRLANFEMGRRAAIDSLVAAHRARLRTTPYLVIDVRGNGGGWRGSYRSVLPLIYAGPITVRGIEVWATPDNAAAMRSGLEAEGLPPELADEMRSVVPRMEANFGRFVTLQEERELRFDTIHPQPRAVAVLVNRGCASACEQFVLEVRQSRKVTVLGQENTHGALDFLNVRSATLPSAARILRLPISRLAGLPAGAVNEGGIAPEVLIPRGEGDALAFASRYLRAGGTSAVASPR